MPSGSLYEILQVQPTADFEIIQAAYRRLMLRHHPDRNDSADAAEMTQRLNQAYEVLSDPVKRTAYDKEIATEPGSNQGSRGSAAGSQSSSSAESSVRLKDFLPSRAWVKGLVAAFAIATFMLFVGPNLTGNPLAWLFGGEDVLTALRGEIPSGTTAGSNSGLDASQNVVSPATALEATPAPDPTAIPIATAVPSLTEREIFTMDSNGAITPTVAALLLRLINQNLNPSLDQPGAITVTGITPMNDVCRYVDCVGGTIPVGQNNPITLNAVVEPINPIPDTKYMVWLADLDGSTLNSQRISWTADQLENTLADEDSGRVKFLSLASPIFDISVPEFIKDYNDVFVSGLEKVENEAIIECSLSIAPDGSLVIGNLECANKILPTFQLEAEQIAAILGRHFIIELMLESEFIERGLSSTD